MILSFAESKKNVSFIFLSFCFSDIVTTSWCLSSNLQSKDLCIKHGMWQIGDNNNIKVWDDRWLEGCQRLNNDINSFVDRVVDLFVPYSN